MLPCLLQQRLEIGKVEPSFDRLDLLPCNRNLQRIGVDFFQHRPDGIQHGGIVDGVIGLSTQYQKWRIIDHQGMPAVPVFQPRY